MSFRLFIYYCALCGAWAAFAGWVLGRAASIEDAVLQQGVKGMSLGLFVALGLGLVDALWNASMSRILQVGARVVLAVLGGAVGGFLGGAIGQALYDLAGRAAAGGPGFVRHLDDASLVLGWAVTGVLIGASLGAYDLLACRGQPGNWPGAARKIRNCVLGGVLGGALGGALSLVLRLAWGRLFVDRPPEQLLSPSALGFIALGTCIGLLIGLAQVILKEAWVKVEAGFRAGRELILSKAETTIGRAEGCDIGLYGDQRVERMHARIVREGGRYLLAAADGASATLLNGTAVTRPTPLHSGDTIRLGNAVLRFHERSARGG
jgi:hypothetical protein